MKKSRYTMLMTPTSPRVPSTISTLNLSHPFSNTTPSRRKLIPKTTSATASTLPTLKSRTLFSDGAPTSTSSAPLTPPLTPQQPCPKNVEEKDRAPCSSSARELSRDKFYACHGSVRWRGSQERLSTRTIGALIRRKPMLSKILRRLGRLQNFQKGGDFVFGV